MTWGRKLQMCISKIGVTTSFVERIEREEVRGADAEGCVIRVKIRDGNDLFLDTIEGSNT
jgi:hypothetical protein